MVSFAGRIGGALGAVAAFVVAVAGGGPSSWVIAGLTASGLALVVVVLFVPSETPARRLGQLIQACRTATAAPTGAEPAGQPSSAPPVSARDGS